ncbi:SETMR methyltransferase, partial [Acromyrmex heyeri]
MESEKVHIRHVMLWEFKQGNSAKGTAEKICSVYGEGLISDRAVRNWFAKFRSGDTTLKDIATQEKILELGWLVLLHPPYSPDLAPTDYHLFCSLQNFLNGKTFNSEEQVSQAVENFFQSKLITFYKEGIDKLPGTWEKVIHNSGEYIIN